MNDIYTIDLSKFGYRELSETKKILDAIIERGYPDRFEVDGIQIGFNTHSGYVFLTNSEFQTAMINEQTSKLEEFYFCPECGFEGFRDELYFSENSCCRNYIKELEEE